MVIKSACVPCGDDDHYYCSQIDDVVCCCGWRVVEQAEL